VKTPKNHRKKAAITLLMFVALCLATWSPVEVARAHSGARIQKISSDLLAQVRRARGDERTRVIVQFKGKRGSTLDAQSPSDGAVTTHAYRSLNARAVELPAAAVERLAARDDVAYVSPDYDVQVLGHVETTTGATAARTLGAGTTYDGAGIGIAVIDSSVFNSHDEFLGRDGNKRIIKDQDFTGLGASGDDPFGHGTHVASLAAGSGRVVDPVTGVNYAGVAPGARIFNLRVLDAQGKGKTSWLLAALDWVMANRTNPKYNIRVVNLSLGAPAVESYTNDPLCRAVRRLVDAGVVVVAAAGNDGKGANGQKVYGRIHSPGNEPSALTVGATNTYQSNSRHDDTVASYSSRGPTRSYSTDATGVKHYDNLIKPDLVAPGNKLIAAESKENTLTSAYPWLNAYSDANDDHEMMCMSGTSMAAPLVAGTVALMLQANPTLTPNLIKAILMYTAQPLAGSNVLEQGAGQLNVEGAVRMARLARHDLTNATPLGANLLTTGSLPTASTTIAGYSFPWAQGVVMGHTYGTGAELMSKYQVVYDTGVLVHDGVIGGNGVLVHDRMKLTIGVSLGANLMVSDGGALGGGTALMASNVLVSTGVLVHDGQVFADGVLVSDGYLLTNGVLVHDTFTEALNVLIYGE
jgi:serine protease AprX